MEVCQTHEKAIEQIVQDPNMISLEKLSVSITDKYHQMSFKYVTGWKQKCLN